jgi:hypothetical protein
VGWSSHWILVDLEDDADIAGRLGLRLGDVSTTWRGPAVGPRWRGWLPVLDPRWQLVGDNHLSRLSQGTRLLRLAVEEHVMFAEAASWRDGREEWAVTGDMDVEQPVVATRGTPPDELLQAQELDAAYDEPMPFNVPVLLIKSMTGWQYDEVDSEIDLLPYRPLRGLEYRDPLAGLNLAAPAGRPVRRREPLTVRWWHRLRRQ